MELIYFIIIFIALIFTEIDCALMKEMSMKVFQTEVIHTSDDEDSLLQCAHKCRFVDKNSVVDFKDSKCRCIRYSTKEQDNELTLSNIFVNKRTMKYVEPPEKLFNAALFQPAKESTTDRGSPANGNDGQLSTYTFTRHTRYQWWYVDLGKNMVIRYMILYGTAGSGSYNRLIYISTNVDGKENSSGWPSCTSIGNLDTSPYKFTCDKPTIARYVSVNADRCRLSIDEFEVYSPVLV